MLICSTWLPNHLVQFARGKPSWKASSEAVPSYPSPEQNGAPAMSIFHSTAPQTRSGHRWALLTNGAWSVYQPPGEISLASLGILGALYLPLWPC
jgi:hypothetical protein